jgi:hypothetical protein
LFAGLLALILIPDLFFYSAPYQREPQGKPLEPPGRPPESSFRPIEPGVEPLEPPADGVDVDVFPTFEAPPTVIAGEPFSVLFQLTEELITPGVQNVPSTLTLPDEAQWPMEVVLTAEGFDFRGPNTAEIVLPRKGDSTVARFQLSAIAPKGEDRTADSRLYASVWYQQSFLFRVSRPVAVVVDHSDLTSVRPLDNPLFGPMRIDPWQPGPDLSVEISFNTMTIRARGFEESKFPYSTSVDLEGFLNERYARLAGLTGRGVQSVDSAPQMTAKGIGRDLYQELAPDPFKKAFWRLVDQYGPGFHRIQVLSDAPVIPWELMVPVRPDGTDEMNHLGLEFEISRWFIRDDLDLVASPPSRIPLEEVVLIAPQYTPPLTGVTREIETLRLFSGERLRRIAASKEGLGELARRESPGVVHFAGHGVVRDDTNRGLEYVILLDDERQLTLDEWKGMVSPLRFSVGTFIFFNACDVGRTAPAVNFVDGWAPHFIDRGASGYIGTLWSVGDEAAARFAATFYGGLSAGAGDVSVSAALLAARQLYLQTADPTYLAYVFYGNERLTLQRQ